MSIGWFWNLKGFLSTKYFCYRGIQSALSPCTESKTYKCIQKLNHIRDIVTRTQKVWLNNNLVVICQTPGRFKDLIFCIDNNVLVYLFDSRFYATWICKYFFNKKQEAPQRALIKVEEITKLHAKKIQNRCNFFWKWRRVSVIVKTATKKALFSGHTTARSSDGSK